FVQIMWVTPFISEWETGGITAKGHRLKTLRSKMFLRRSPTRRRMPGIDMKGQWRTFRGIYHPLLLSAYRIGESRRYICPISKSFILEVPTGIMLIAVHPTKTWSVFPKCPIVTRNFHNSRNCPPGDF